MKDYKLFYELILVALGQRAILSKNPSEEEWTEIYSMCQKQAVAGVAFVAVEQLSSCGQKPPIDLLMDWMGLNEQIRYYNDVLDKRSAEVTALFRNAGFPCCILKGQGNARLYTLPKSRTPGDIDIWVFGKRSDITKFVRSSAPEAFEMYHHIEFPIYNDAEVEVHYTPGELFIPKYNSRFQQWCESQKELVLNIDTKVSDFVVPSVEFNAVYQMAHMMIHFFIEGIGLRHFIDYYFVLKAFDCTKHKELSETLRWLGLEKFAKGVMWIEHEKLRIPLELLPLEISKEVGIAILSEMEAGGNLGQFDKRYPFRKNGVLMRGLADGYRLLRLAKMFPSETTWKMIHKIKNQKWKFKHKL